MSFLYRAVPRLAGSMARPMMFAPQTASHGVNMASSSSTRFFGSGAPAAGGAPAGASGLKAAEVEERVVTVVKKFDKVDPSKVKADSHFANDLGLDSLDTVEVVMAFEDEFAIEIPDADAERIQSVADAIKYVLANPASK